MTASTLMIQGTTSNAGKSTLAAALCRCLRRRGVRVAPFKPQNMALNSAVTIDGGEIGRAQAVQAQACGIEPHSDMNPILLKPTSNRQSQVIIQGQVHGDMNAAAFHKFKSQAKRYVLESFGRLSERFDAIVVEGAGSPAEINLREGDIANMGFAEAVDCPVILVANIELGGVFAHIVGTLDLLSDTERQLIQGVVINRFRGDVSLLKPGIDWLEQRIGKKVIGVMPFIEALQLEAEDSVSIKSVHTNIAKGKVANPTNSSDAGNASCEQLRIVVPLIPRISNHTDFEPLLLHPQVDFTFVKAGESIPCADLIILPGSKSVKDDLDWLHQHEWPSAIKRHLRYGGKLIGICGGFQMLGKQLKDPNHVESGVDSFEGLGLLNMETTFHSKKHLSRVSAIMRMKCGDSAEVSGYEIHMGQSTGSALSIPLLQGDGWTDGAISDDDQIIGTYLHGLFDQAVGCSMLLHWAGLKNANATDFRELCEAQIERLADVMGENLDFNYICTVLGIESKVSLGSSSDALLCE